MLENIDKEMDVKKMFKLERKFLAWIDKNIYTLTFLGITIIGFLIRISLRRYQSGDAAMDLLPWYDEIQRGGGILSLGHQVGSYNLLYQFLIALMTYIPIKPLYAYKVLSCIFDYLLALSVGYLIYEVTMEGKKWKALAGYGMVVLSPLVFVNSALWAQCDSIYTFWIVLTLIFLMKGKYVRAFVFFGVALAFKLQAIFLLPFLLFLYFALKKFSFVYFAMIPAVMGVSVLPCMIMGRKLTDVFDVYFGQTGEYKAMSMNYPSFWVLINNAVIEETYETYKTAAILFTVCILAAWMVVWTVRKTELNKQNMLYMAFVIVYTCVLFLPAMHERYGCVYEILAIAILFLNRKTIPLFVALLGMSLFTYGFYLHGSTIHLSVLSVINFVVYLSYSFMLFYPNFINDEKLGKIFTKKS